MNIFTQFAKALYSPKDIAKFRFQGIGKTILYVFILTLLSIIPTTYQLVNGLSNAINAVGDTLKEDIPSFTIENGQLSLDQTTPVIIEKNEFTIVLDSTGTIDAEDFNYEENVIGLLKNEYLFIFGGQAQSNSYAAFNGLKITEKELLAFIESTKGLKIIFLPVIFIVVYIFSSGIKFIEVSILALIGLLIKNLLNKNVPYRQSWRMAAYSITLPTVFFTLMAALDTRVPNGILINWFVSIIILTLAIKEIPSKKPKVAVEK
jgi:hypothetical protein